MSSFVIVVTPTEGEFRELASLDELPAHVRADLEALRDEVSERFPEAEAIGETGALCSRPEIEGVGVVIRPEVITRPLVVNAVMRFAAPRQLRVTSPELGLVADPRERIDIDVHRRPAMTGAGIADHAVRGRPRGTLPWVTRELLSQLIGKLMIDGDRLELGVDDERWFRYERSGRTLLIEASDGPDVPRYRLAVPVDAADTAADAGWAWARCDQNWAGCLAGDAPASDGDASPAADGTGDRGRATAA
ncbi:hypothetical protein [Dietzia sp. B32]|uniref:hypothetical protein n=1 Tax=Dietzia sp. B32 TaxID=2915130 RepID=UPI0021AE2F32|nr:hypothetical protein [Dietzia sp. B32]UVE96585.1 hypothetical protein L8M95_07430 [Dietzia sp. B32]